ncbi:MAG TPA: prepilin-type N-terminal cleavage/methylation domain-containing protein [Stenotrophobium sp.]|jgi:prepilin peptidase dependent protein B|nr:prepilin-type N-terminal cleavage/methylation domain-containing protein [Stenotrophobium sp.]
MRRNDRVGRNAGFSLVELMIALTLGLMLTAGLISMFMATLRSNSDLARTQQLENELHAGMQVMTRDLRRAGANGKASPVPNFINPFGLGATGAYAGETADSCILFSYDLNDNGVLDTAGTGDERMGYRLRQGVLQLRNSGLGCADDGWTDVTTPAVVRVTQLQFSVAAVADGDMTIRRVTINLAGQLKDDATIARSLVGRVRVRNDAWTPSP